MQISDNFIRSFIAMVLLLWLGSCIPSRQATEETDPPSRKQELDHAFNIPEQVSPPREVQSLQLYPVGKPDAAPVIEMDENNKLAMEFDYLSEGSRQFRVVVSHRNNEWEQSSLPPDFFLDGFNETYFSSGKASFSNRPSYTRYRFEFPGSGSDFSFKTSGNYLLSVYDFNTGDLLFTLPFFVSENAGSLQTRLETLFARQNSTAPRIQPFGRYHIPPFVEFPQFNLSFYFAPNQFWGRTQKAEHYNQSTSGTIDFHLGRAKAFESQYALNILDLRELSANGNEILEVRRDTVPPLVIMRRDIVAFDQPSPFPDVTRMDIREGDRSAAYATVQFRLEINEDNLPSTNIYVVGDFNEWTLNERNRMRFDPESELWTGTAMAKEGRYRYAYVQVKNHTITDIRSKRSFLFDRQNYFTFVYYKDPSRNFDRLLKVIQTEGP